MLRSIAFIALSIRLSNPAISEPTAEAHARVIREEAAEHKFDPITQVSIISHESAWNPRADNGNDFGLCQINIVNLNRCREDRSSTACKVQIERMKNPAVNLRTCAALITTTREFCRRYKRSRHAWFAEWLSQFQGLGRGATKGTKAFCLWRRHPSGRLVRAGSAPRHKVKAHRFTKKVISYRRCLLKEIARGRRPGDRRFKCQPWYGKA
jgi:hypothetical protein